MLRIPTSLPPRDLPDPLPVPGLSFARAQYLHKQIREFCTAETRDVTCPAPKPIQEVHTSEDSGDSTDDDAPLAKIARATCLH